MLLDKCIFITKDFKEEKGGQMIIKLQMQRHTTFLLIEKVVLLHL